MNIQPLSQETTINIVKNGVYYCPASKHYNNQSSNIVCDRCRKTHLNVCIGLDTYDLCLSCVQDVSMLCTPQILYTKDTETVNAIENCLIKASRPCEPSESVRTLMEQRLFGNYWSR